MTRGVSFVSLAHAAGYLIKVSAIGLTPPGSPLSSDMALFVADCVPVVARPRGFMVISRSLLRITLLPAAVRKRAATRLGLRASPGNLRSLVRSLQDEDASVREASLESLVKLGSSSVPELVREVMTDSSSARATMAAALGRFGSMSSTVVPTLEQLLRDPSSAVRATAAGALALIGPLAASAVAGLVRVAQDNEVEPVAAAVKALGRIGAAARSSLPASRRLAAQA